MSSSTPPPMPPPPPQRNTPVPAPSPGPSALTIVMIIVAVFVGIFVILGILAALAMPAYNGIRQKGMMTKSLSNQRQISLALRIYATDHNGIFPASTAEGEPFKSSQDAFNGLFPDYIDSEFVFWMPTPEPEHLRPPREDGVLERGECVYGYAAGQKESSDPKSPLVFDGFLDSNLGATEYLPFFKRGKAGVAFVDGHIAMLPLTSKEPGATICTQDKVVTNILLPRGEGGLLDTRQENVVLPIGF